MSGVQLGRRGYVAAAAAVVVLAAVSTLAFAVGSGALRDSSEAPNGQCSAPTLAGTVVDVTLTNMGHMMGSQMGGAMRVLLSADHVRPGTVSLRVANTGTLTHELVVLPLSGEHRAGDRTPGSDGRVDETGSVGEASKTCGEGSGDGIDPGALGWTTITLNPGRYELVCNLPGHYQAGMSTTLTVT